MFYSICLFTFTQRRIAAHTQKAFGGFGISGWLSIEFGSIFYAFQDFITGTDSCEG